MQEALKNKTPVHDLLELLITTQKLEQHYTFQIEFEADHSVLHLLNKEHRMKTQLPVQFSVEGTRS